MSDQLLKIELDAESERFFRTMEFLMPGEVRKAEQYAVAGAKRQFGSIVGQGGKPDKGVPKLQKHALLTEDLGGKWVPGKKPGTRSRRKLFDGEKVQIASNHAFHVAYKRGGTWHVGFPERLDKFMGGLLERASYAFTPGQKRAFHIAGVDNVPEMYERPQRHIVEPWSAYLQRGVFAGWMVSVLEKNVKKKITRLGRVVGRFIG